MQKHKTTWTPFIVLAVLAVLFVIIPTYVHAQEKPDITLFYGQGCPHCAKVEQYIEDNNLTDLFSITEKEVYSDSANAQELTQYFTTYNVPSDQQGVPFLIMNGTYYVGDTPIISALGEQVQKMENNETTTPETNTNEATSEPATSNSAINIWSVTGAALVDAINPCAFAVLIILMGTVLAAKKRKRALLSGILFSVAIYLSYLAMGFGLYAAVAAASARIWIEKIIGILAILLGFFNIKDAIWYGKGFLMEVPMGWRPRLKKLIHSVTNPIVAFGVGIVVSLFLLPCTSGPYIVIIGMLGTSATFKTAALWLVYYNLIFILPMLMITVAVYFGLQPERLEAIRQKQLRLLHAIAGIILLSLGLYLIL